MFMFKDRRGDHYGFIYCIVWWFHGYRGIYWGNTAGSGKTRRTGLRLSLTCIVILLSIGFINKHFLKYEDEPIATITPGEYKK